MGTLQSRGRRKRRLHLWRWVSGSEVSERLPSAENAEKTSLSLRRETNTHTHAHTHTRTHTHTHTHSSHLQNTITNATLCGLWRVAWGLYTRDLAIEDSETEREWKELREWCAARLDDACEGTDDWPFALPTLPLPRGRKLGTSHSPRPPLPFENATKRRREAARKQKVVVVAGVAGVVLALGVVAFALAKRST